MARTRYAHLAAAASLLLACTGSSSGESVELPAAPTHVLATDLARELQVTVPADMVVHAQDGAIQATAGDGSYRVHVGRLEGESLIKLAGPAKDALAARGWTVKGEQHLESAIRVSLERGASREHPAERREIWWVQRGSRYFSCDGIASGEGQTRLGDDLRELCQGVRLKALPDPTTPEPPEPVGSGGAGDQPGN